MANKFSNLVTFWRLQGMILEDEELYWHREHVPFVDGKEPRQDVRFVVRRMIAGKKHGTRAEIIYRTTEYLNDDRQPTETKINGLINADLIFAWQNEVFIKHASLRQLEDYVS